MSHNADFLLRASLWQESDVDQTWGWWAMLLPSPPLARSFKGGGKKIEPRLSQILSVLADYGRIQRAGEGRYRG